MNKLIKIILAIIMSVSYYYFAMAQKDSFNNDMQRYKSDINHMLDSVK